MAGTDRPVGIIGGGPAGLGTALALRNHGLDACVIEHGGWNAPRAGEHLAADARPTLARLGLASLCDQAAPCRGVQSAWGSTEPQFHDLHLFAPLGGGFLVDRVRFDQGMLAQARSRGVVCMERTRLVAAARAQARGSARGPWLVKLRTGTVDAVREFSFLVDATGRSAGLARTQGARVVVYDRLVGVSARARPSVSGDNSLPERAHAACDNRLHIWSAEDGWWYVATLPDGERVATWMTDAHRVGRLARAEQWKEHCARHFAAVDARLGLPRELATAAWERPRSWPAHSQCLRRPHGDGWVAVGDAALAFDPLSSAGIAKALRGACQAADAIQQALAGHPDALARYGREVLQDWRRYLDQRCDYYRLEHRFPGSAFWRDRQHQPAHRQPVTLDPQQPLLPAPGASEASAAAVLARRLPEIDGGAVFRRLARGDLAHRVVRDIIERQEVDDHAAIVAVQLLVEHGVLSCAAPFTNRATSF